MNKRGGIVLPFLIILLLIMLSLSGASLYLLQQERTEKLNLKTELENALAKYKKSSLELEDARRQISTLNSQLTETNNKIQAVTQELEEEKLAREAAFSNIEQLKSELEKEKDLKSGLEAKVKQAEEDALKIKEQMTQLTAQKSELETKIKELEAKNAEAQVELGKIVVDQNMPQSAVTEEQAVEQAGAKQESPVKQEKAEKQKKPKAGLKEGKVLVVNKDYNFAVINLGSKDKVNIGDIFSIYHDNNYVGDIKVEKVHESMAAAGFLSEELKNKVSEEDKVVQKAK